MTDSSPKQLPPYGLRIPPDLKEAIQKAAKTNNRSMHAEIIARLEKSFGANDDFLAEMRAHMGAAIDNMHQFVDEGRKHLGLPPRETPPKRMNVEKPE
jgi:hypothetical protein